MTNRSNEAIKQTRVVKDEVDDSEVLQELEHALEALQKALKALEDDE